MLKYFFKFVAFAVLLNLVATQIGDYFNLRTEPSGSLRVTIALIIWWAVVLAGLYLWLVIAKKREQDRPRP